jgi:hypothetical protein
MTKEKAHVSEHAAIASSAKSSPAEVTVAKLAYELWSQRGCPEGSPEHDWFQAEHLLRAGTTTIASSA